MNWKNHMISTAIFAIAFLILVNKLVDFPFDLIEWTIFVGIASMAALLPDIDIENSELNKFLFPVIFIIIGITIGKFTENIYLIVFISLISVLAFYKIYKFITKRHRGPTHSILFGIIASLPVAVYVNLLCAGAVFFGIMAHIFEDRILADKLKIGRGKRYG